MLVAAALAVVAQAQAPSVEFGTVRHEVSFGQQVAFFLEATVAQEPQRVWLVYRLAGERAENVADASFSGAPDLSAEYLWELYPGDMPPGATVSYRWAIQTADGTWVESDESAFTYDDTRFQWQVLEASPLRVYYYQNANMAQGVLDASTAALERLGEAIGVQTTEPISIYVYATERDMSPALPSRSESYDAATVTLGMAMDNSTLLLLGRTADVNETAAHELSHIVVGRATDNPFNDLTRWLDEGLAMYAEGQLAAGNQEALDDAIRGDRVLSLRSMTSYPGSPNLVDLYYGEAYSIAAYMLDGYAPEQMRQLLGMLAEGRPMEEALSNAYGLTLQDLETGWRAGVGLGPLPEEQTPAVTPTPAARGGLEHPAATPTPAIGESAWARSPWQAGLTPDMERLAA
ncbi:MAG: peptidase MA family metallohydrolase [Anaerolineae bacterium]